MNSRARDNPFRTDRVLQIRYWFEQRGDWDQLLQRLSELGWRGAIVGPEGSGKTTLQEDLADRLAAAGRPIAWLRINRENRSTAGPRLKQVLASSDSRTLVFVDGAEQLGPLLWRRLERRSRQCGGLVITTHQPGRLPTLFECRTTPLTLRRIVGQLLPPDTSPTGESLERLFARSDGNLRLCLRALYDDWAGGWPCQSGQATSSGRATGSPTNAGVGACVPAGASSTGNQGEGT
jgi:hypothetical protein